MAYIARELTENVNVSKTHPLIDLAWLLGGVALILSALYLFLGLAAQFAASRIPVEAEAWLGSRALARLEGRESPALQERLDTLLQALPENSPLHRYPFTVSRVEAGEINALALPGGHILVFSGLLAAVQSENELSMVLAHELGHYAHRDHLKGLGRGLGVAVASLLIFGPESGVTGLVHDVSLGLEARYSQKQEAEADAFALDLLVKSAGHAGGATDLFARFAAEKGGRFLSLLASHPHPEARVEAIQALIAQNGYSVQPTRALGADLLESGEGKTEE